MREGLLIAYVENHEQSYQTLSHSRSFRGPVQDC